MLWLPGLKTFSGKLQALRLLRAWPCALAAELGHCITLHHLWHVIWNRLHHGFTPALDSAVKKNLFVIPLSTWSVQKPSPQRENLIEELSITVIPSTVKIITKHCS